MQYIFKNKHSQIVGCFAKGVKRGIALLLPIIDGVYGCFVYFELIMFVIRMTHFARLKILRWGIVLNLECAFVEIGFGVKH